MKGVQKIGGVYCSDWRYTLQGRRARSGAAGGGYSRSGMCLAAWMFSGMVEEHGVDLDGGVDRNVCRIKRECKAVWPPMECVAFKC